MKKSEVLIIKNDSKFNYGNIDINNINVPKNKLPVTKEFDNNKCIGFARVFKRDGNIYAEIEMKPDSDVDLVTYSGSVKNKKLTITGISCQ